MTTPTTPTPADLFRAEIRQQFADLHMQIQELSGQIETIREGLNHASQPAPAASGQTQKFIVTRIERETRKNKNYYRAFGPLYPKFGVKIWDEVFPALGFDLEKIEWKDGYIFEIVPPLEVVGMMETYADKETGETKIGINKVIGKA